MIKPINKATVIGAGVMGAGIAALLAGVGVQVSLLDIIPPQGLSDKEKAKGITEQSPVFRNRFAAAGLRNIKSPKTKMLYSASKINNIRIGNITDNIDYLDDADWIIEVVVERLDAKKNIVNIISSHAKKDAIISSNTSGVSITKIVEDMDDDFKARFLGTHFFNPPRFMGLFEMIPTKWTSNSVVERIADFATNGLGKTVVYAKDTPNFVGNRIGCYAAIKAMQLAEVYEYDLPTVDYLTGVVMGHPKTATFKTSDLVGLDIVANVSKNVLESSTDSKEIEEYSIPQFVSELIENGALGNKTKCGFYKKDVVDGKKSTLAFNYKTKQYEATKATKFESVDAAMKSKNKYEVMAFGETKECKFYWECLKKTLLYSASLVPEIADDFREIDKAMTTGFNWEIGPFQIWDKMGVCKVADKMIADGESVPKWVLDMLESNKTSFYSKDDVKSAFTILKNCDVVKENEDTKIRDIGNGVLCLEFCSRGNAITVHVLDMIQEAISLLHNDEWKGMVIGNDGKHFCAGADLVEIVRCGQEKEFDKLDVHIRRLQAATSAIKYSPKPVVAAPFGVTYGGGCEVSMHARSCVPYVETYMGLVETGVGLVPAGGGCTEMTLRAMARCYNEAKKSRFDAIKDVWKNIMTGKVTGPAYDSIESNYLSESTYVEMRREKVINSAKHEVLIMSERGYHPSADAKIKVMGDYGKGAILSDIEFMRGGNFLSDYDVVIGKKIANIVCGGELAQGTEIRAQQMLDLEREAFLSLSGDKRTQDRITGMLKTGKPVRN